MYFLEKSGDSSEDVQEMSLTWLTENNNICLWPPTNTSHHIINNTLPMATWNKKCRLDATKIVICSSNIDEKYMD